MFYVFWNCIKYDGFIFRIIWWNYYSIRFNDVFFKNIVVICFKVNIILINNRWDFFIWDEFIMYYWL